jgi:hypothetical protein
MIVIDHRSRTDLEALRSALSAIDAQGPKAGIVAFLIATELMLPRGLAMKTLRLVARAKSAGDGGFGPLTQALSRPFAAPLVDDVMKQALHWLVEGRDASDPASAGGWNSDELRKLTTYLDAIGVELPKENDRS